MSIFEGLSPKYLKSQLDRLSNINLSLTELRDALVGPNNRTLTDIYDRLGNIGGSVSITNFPSWFTSSTKTTDDILSKLDALDNALASVGTDKLRTSLVDPLPAGNNWIGNVRVGDGTNVAAVVSGTLGGSAAKLLGVAPDLTKVFAGGTAYTEQEVSVSTTEATSSFDPPLKTVVLTNEGDVDITIKLNGGSTTKTLSARETKIIAFFEISDISYVVSSGSSTLKIEGYW
ncbi:MAG: hypothetical protein DRZ76_04080 [Candidatus Nealsonbacteria bacterium]|nr:MAG: hypothetical protein DRZ76_04080 [Candidatus Nealsonbacteria bacterium]